VRFTSNQAYFYSSVAFLQFCKQGRAGNGWDAGDETAKHPATIQQKQQKQ
jgi:hypothetical protein